MIHIGQHLLFHDCKPVEAMYIFNRAADCLITEIRDRLSRLSAALLQQQHEQDNFEMAELQSSTSLSPSSLKKTGSSLAHDFEVVKRIERHVQGLEKMIRVCRVQAHAWLVILIENGSIQKTRSVDSNVTHDRVVDLETDIQRLDLEDVEYAASGRSKANERVNNEGDKEVKVL